ncbi:hypothetical protein ACHAXR_008793 [Thalassiosira sp. AJA248-18]
MDKTSGKMLNYQQLMRHPEYKGPWSLSSANEFGRLAYGAGGRIKKPTNTIKFIRKEDIPMERHKDVTYGQFVCTVRLSVPKSLNLTEHGSLWEERINYPGEVATPTVDMLVAKTLFNSIIATPGAIFMTMNISNIQLLSNDPAEHEDYQHSPGNHRQIQTQRHSHKGWLHLHLHHGHSQNVWTTAGE